MSAAVNRTVRRKAATLFTRRVSQLNVDALLPVRFAWAPTPDGFTVTLWALRDSGTQDPLAVQLVAIPCHFGGQRHLFQCPACEHRRTKLYWYDDRLLCQACAELRYVSVTWTSDERLERHY